MSKKKADSTRERDVRRPEKTKWMSTPKKKSKQISQHVKGRNSNKHPINIYIQELHIHLQQQDLPTAIEEGIQKVIVDANYEISDAQEDSNESRKESDESNE